MIEKEIEDLIANYPEEFFPDRGFQLKGRQESFAGVGRFDLLFTDRYQTNILMELKAVPANYEVATQLAKYKDELQRQGQTGIWMWLIAPQISTSVREFLDRIGIEYREIHVGEFRRVAERHGMTLRSEVVDHAPEASGVRRISYTAREQGSSRSPVPQVETGPRVTIHRCFDGRHTATISI